MIKDSELSCEQWTPNPKEDNNCLLTPIKTRHRSKSIQEALQAIFDFNNKFEVVEIEEFNSIESLVYDNFIFGTIISKIYFAFFCQFYCMETIKMTKSVWHNLPYVYLSIIPRECV